MTPERWQEIDKLLDSVLNLEESHRLAFIDQACRDDQELRHEVEALLRAYEQSVSFFELPAVHTTLKGISRNKKPSLEGRHLGSYRIVSLLGAGGMGEVYRAVDTRLSRTVAIKILPAHLSEESALRQQFEQEAQAISQLNHPHICTLYDVGKQDGIHFLVMEYLEGETLAQRLEKGPLPLNQVVGYALEIASALEEAHTRGIVHRDLKPGNIMLTKYGAKLLDFGLVKWLEKTGNGTAKPSGQDATTEGIVRGTVCYMSPEHVAGKSTDIRSDIFSFGSVLYEMATGQRAFQGNSMLAIWNAILREDPRPASQIKGGISSEMERIIIRCLCKDPERRWQSMGDVKLALLELKENEENKGAVTALGLKNRGRHSLVWVAGLILLIALVSLTAIFTQRNTRLSESVFTAVPLTSYPGMESQASFSPDGNQVAFRWNGEKEDNFDIYVKSVGAEPPLRLTTDQADDYSPAWSPDGRYIAFCRNQPGGEVSVVLTSPLPGQERILAKTSTYGNVVGAPFLAWSLDCKSLIMVGRDTLNELPALFMLSLETGEKRRLTLPPANSMGDSGTAISPDGRSLAFCRWTAWAASDLYLLDLPDDSKPPATPRRLTFGNWLASSPAWTPDGRELVFSVWTSTGSSLWRIIPSSSGGPQQLTSIAENVSYPTLSRLQHRLAYVRVFKDTNIWRVEIPSSSRKVKPPEKIISSTRMDWHCQYSPDGRKIAFVSDRSGSIEIWVCNEDGSNAVPVTSFGKSYSIDPRWSPDSSRLAFYSHVDGQAAVYVVNANGAQPQRLFADFDTSANPSWSSDGRWIYVDGIRKGLSGFWRAAEQGGDATELNLKKNEGWAPTESPDGRFIYFSRNSVDGFSLFRVPREGGAEQKVLDCLSAWCNYALVEDGIFFIPRPDPKGESSIQFWNRITGSIKPIASIHKPVEDGFAVSPDHRWILYSQVDHQGSDLMLVDHFQ